jgi:superfamily I DNA and RNA helicase
VSSSPSASSSDPAAIESDIVATRDHLKNTVDELAHRLTPKEIARRSVADAKDELREATTNSDGSLRVERIAAVAGAVLAVVALLAMLRHRRSS